MNLKQKIASHHVSIGSWVTLNSPENIEIMGQFDFEWLVVDMEHSAIDIPQVQNLVRVIQSTGKPALVRVEENNTNIIKRVMDSGAQGVVVPMIKTRADAEAAVAAVKYPTQGIRGVGLTRAQGYGQRFEEYKKWLREESIVVLIIEHIDALQHLEEILSVDGVDATMIGPYDLSGSMGYPGDYDRPDVREAIGEYLQISKKMKKPAGFHSVPPKADLLKEKIEEGFRFLALSTDALFLAEGVKSQLEQLK